MLFLDTVKNVSIEYTFFFFLNGKVIFFDLDIIKNPKLSNFYNVENVSKIDSC